MSGFNQAQVLGHLGRDPETRALADGTVVASVSVATNEKWRDKASGEKKERTEWHRVQLWGRAAEVARDYLRKGSLALFQGPLRTREWTDKDNVKRYTTEIHVRDTAGLKLLGGGDREDKAPARPAAAKAPPGAAPSPAPPAGQDFDDEIPF